MEIQTVDTIDKKAGIEKLYTIIAPVMHTRIDEAKGNPEKMLHTITLFARHTARMKDQKGTLPEKIFDTALEKLEELEK